MQAAQVSYDPRWIKQHIGGHAGEHPALPQLYGLQADELDSPKAHKMYEEASAINFLTADDAPAFLFYTESKERGSIIRSSARRSRRRWTR